MKKSDEIEKYLRILEELSNEEDDDISLQYRYNVNARINVKELLFYEGFANYIFSVTGIDGSDLTNAVMINKFNELLNDLIASNNNFYETFDDYIKGQVRGLVTPLVEDFMINMMGDSSHTKKSIKEITRKITRETNNKIKEKEEELYKEKKAILRKIVDILDSFGFVDKLLEQNKGKENILNHYLNKQKFLQQLSSDKSLIEIEAEMIFYINKLTKILENLRTTSFIFAEKGLVVNDQDDIAEFKKSFKMQGQICLRYKIISSFLSLGKEIIRKRSFA